MNIYVYAQSYDENSGGSIALHKLTHLINEHTNHHAFLVPRVLEKIDISNVRSVLNSAKLFLSLKKEKLSYKTNAKFNTPVVKNIQNIDRNGSIAIYPEVTFGNPLMFRNVVRWFLHQPGNFTGEVCFGPGELYFRFGCGIRNFELFSSKTSKHELKIIHYPLDIYNDCNAASTRSGTCYLVRKGKNKPFVHDQDAIQIDGLQHEQIANLFKKCERFISYDDYSAYSIFAVLCGCKSIVVPHENKSVDEWMPNPADRYGVSYGFNQEQSDWAEETKNKLREFILEEHERSKQAMLNSVTEIEEFFQLIDKNR